MNVELKRTDRIAFPMGILDLVVQSDQQRAFAACMDGIYAIDFDRDTKAEKPAHKIRRVGRHDSYVSSLGLLENPSELISTAWDGSMHVRDISNLDQGEELQPRVTERIHNFWSWDMALAPDGRSIASVTGQYLAGTEDYSPAPSAEPTIKILEARTGKLLHAMEMLPPVQCVAFDSSSRYVAAANLMGDMAVWDAVTGKQLASWRSKEFTSWGIIKSHCYIGGIYAITFAPDSESILVAGMGDMRDPMAGNGKQLWHRYAWRQETPQLLQSIKKDEAGEGLMETLAWHPSGKYFVMAGRLRGGNWNLGVFDAQDGKLIGQAKTGMRITTARFSPDGQTLFLAGMQGQPQPKENVFPDFGYLETYSWHLKEDEKTEKPAD